MTEIPCTTTFGGRTTRLRELDTNGKYTGWAPGNSLNQGWVAVSGLRGVIDPAGCPNAVERGRSQGRLSLYALAGFEPLEAARDDDRVPFVSAIWTVGGRIWSLRSTHRSPKGEQSHSWKSRATS